MYYLLHSIVLLKNFLIINGSQGTARMGLLPTQNQMEIQLTEQTISSTWPFMQGNNSNETNINKRHSKRRAESGHGQWPETLRSRYRSTIPGAEKG